MALPKYADIAGGPDGTNSAGHQYKNYGTASSDGTPGKYHIYYDGHVEFVPDPATITVDPTPVSYSTGPIAAPAPANPTGGTQAPDSAAAPAADPVPAATSSRPQKPNNDFDWQFNEEKNAWYYLQLHQGTDGSAGFLHHYADGTTVYVAKTPPQPSTGINSSDTMQTGPSNLPAFNSQPSSDSGHDTATVVGSSSSTGVNNADGLHGTSGFTGHASELHTDTPAVAAVPDTPAATPVEAATPAPADASPAADPSHIYTVAEGDSMWDIAQAHHMTLEQLEALNPQVQNPELIMPGQQLNLGNGEAVVPASVASSDSAVPFPETSTYSDSTTTKPQDAEPHKVGVGGWTDGTNSIPNDPTHGIASVAQTNTDPLKIDENKSS